MTDDKPLSRRDLLRGRFFRKAAEPLADRIGQLADAAGQLSDEFHAPPAPTLPVLHRPPGAIEELAFTAQCTKCDACVQACPVDAITHAPTIFAKAAGTPIIEPKTKACVMCDERACIAACQTEGSGVLDPALPEKMGTARVLQPSCLAFMGESCQTCYDECPVEGAIELVAGVPSIDAGPCTGCGKCQEVCPAPRNAIAIIPMAKRPPRKTLDTGN
jgi:ferredoxin-type protein NapG